MLNKLIEYPTQHTYDNLKKKLLYTLESYKKTLEPVKTTIRSTTNFICDDRYVTHLDEIITKLTTSINFRGLDTDIVEEISETNINNTFINYHTGYLDYLLCAWQQHLGIEVGPWHLWNILLWNIKEISKNIELQSEFKSLWSKDINQTLKRNINIKADTFNINLVKETLNDTIPSETIKALILNFDDSPPNYIDSIFSLLGDNSYDSNINTHLPACNIPKVIILGTNESWILLIQQIKNIKNMFAPFKNYKINKYLSKVESYFNDCIKNLNSQDYWINFFYIDNCDSGQQKEISGHIKKLFNCNELLLSSMPNIISKMEYSLDDDNTNIPKGRYISGVLASTINDDNILIPSFCHITTIINLSNNIATPSRIQENMQLVKACSILNSYSRSPIYHHEITEDVFYRYYDTTEVILGSITIDEFINRLKTTHGDGFNEESVKDNITKLIKQHKDSDRISLLKSFVVEKMNNLETKYNFWFKNISSMPWKECQRINLTTELWLEGRMRQTPEDIKLVCDNLNHIIDNLYLERIFEQKNTKIERIIFSSYNENIYHNYVSLCADDSNESDDELDYGKDEENEENEDDTRFDIDDNYVTSVTIKTLSRIIHFLLMNIRVNGSPFCIDYLNYPTHTDLISESLINGLMLKYNVDTCVKVYNRLVRDRIIPMINKIVSNCHSNCNDGHSNYSNGIDELRKHIQKIEDGLPSNLNRELIQLYQYLYILKLPIKTNKLDNIKSLSTMTVNILEKAGIKATVENKTVIIVGPIMSTDTSIATQPIIQLTNQETTNNSYVDKIDIFY